LLRIATAAALLAVLTGCSHTSQPVGAPAEPHLEATLVSPVDITLDWSGTPSDTSSTIVEFATEPTGRYTVLDFVAPAQHTFKHPDLMPNTPFYYRVTPVHGPVSAAVDVQLPAATTFTARTTSAAHPGSVRTGAGTPTDVTAKSVSADGVRVSWTDNASDEDGYLLEIKASGEPQYRVVGVIDPNSTFTELSTLPAERKASYRIRAYYRGTPSNLAHQTTGAENS
jgi:hypothetical protein